MKLDKLLYDEAMNTLMESGMEVWEAEHQLREIVSGLPERLQTFEGYLADRHGISKEDALNLIEAFELDDEVIEL